MPAAAFQAAFSRRGRRLKAGCSHDWLPHIAASRNEWWRFSEVAAGASKGGRRIDSPPDPEGTPENLPHQFVAAREENDRQ